MDRLMLNRHPELRGLCSLIGGVKVSPKTPDFVFELEEEVKRKYSMGSLLDEPVIRGYRRFFWSIGIDPTKERPSSEALIRRILSGRGLYRINNVVDAMNMVSALTGVVMSVFDAEKISFPITLKPASGGEKILVIGGKEAVAPPGFPILVDFGGKVFSMTVYRDGEETKVTNKTKKVLLVAYIPKTMDIALGRKAIRMAEELICRVAKGGVIEKQYA